MEWTTEANCVYREILQNAIADMPSAFKKLARAKVSEYDAVIRCEVEKKTKERNSQLVEEVDIVEAMKQWCSPDKRKFLIKILKESGVDINKYFKKTEIFQALY